MAGAMGEMTTNCPEGYRHMRYRIRWEGRYVAAVNHVSGLLRSLPGGRRSSGDIVPAPESTTAPHWLPVVLERGVTRDAEFAAWASSLAGAPQGQSVHPAADQDRRELTIELCNEAGQLVVSYVVHRAWVEGFESLPIDEHGEVSLIERLVVAHEGWERDIDRVEPAAVG